ncbi:response regulator [Microbacterium sp. SLBN-146]|uniref:response regulator n=1 Tax=Microbacterium sp. SLBN-146 TaxID=2768457 RepID=UPI00114F5F24|nr:response regulator [Microbacterium sp. SLBN-146]TQJ31295.1 response regulator of citrate/malate metabolism [Microbacterium sp. SLBN-146]
MTDSTIRVVLVDDDPAVLRLHSSYLAGLEGFVLVGTARTGRAGAELATTSGVDLVLLDMNLPDFSGIEVLHRIRMLRDWEVDVFVISSARDAFTIRQAAAAHVAGYLVKPFTREAFADRLGEYRRARGDRPREVSVGLAQGEIDGLVGLAGLAGLAPQARTDPAAASPEALPKGLSLATLQLILAALHPSTPISVRAIADASGASRATVRRYLDHLIARGLVTTSHRFGARGRPEVLYRRAPG